MTEIIVIIVIIIVVNNNTTTNNKKNNKWYISNITSSILEMLSIALEIRSKELNKLLLLL